MLDIPSILHGLNEYKSQKLKIEKILPCTYGVSRGFIKQNEWEMLLKVLEKDDFLFLLKSFLEQFEVPDKLIHLMDNLYGLSEGDEVYLKIDTKRITYKPVFTEDQKGNFILLNMEMPLMYQYILDPCITAFVFTYYRALLNFVEYKVKYADEQDRRFFHKPQCSSPWLEEVYCFAFEMVFETDGTTGGCSSDKSRRDVLSCVPNIVLETFDNDGTYDSVLETMYGSRGLADESIVKVKATKVGITNGILHNTYCWRNVVSPYINNFPAGSCNSTYIYVDTYFGYSYNEDLMMDDTVLYGDSLLTPVPLEKVLDIRMDDWLRIPFIKIGKVKVKNEDELIELLLNLHWYDGNLLFRGQTTEYFLNRSGRLMKKLYGDEQAKEPSLASYALRTGKNFEDFYVEWSELIQSYLYFMLGAKECRRYLEHKGGFEFYYLCLAIAQHYGLPTYGLDASPSLSTALFFALYEFKEKDEGQRIFQYVKKKSGESVLYVFKGEPGERFAYEDLTNSLHDIEKTIFPRPFLQKACFLHTGWGNSRNACACDMVLAINFDVKNINFDKLNALLQHKVKDKALYENNFFVKNDPFIIFLKEYIALENDKGHNKEFKQFLKDYIYQIYETEMI